MTEPKSEKVTTIIAVPKLGKWRASIDADDETVIVVQVLDIEQMVAFGDYVQFEGAKHLKVSQRIPCFGRSAALMLATAINTRDW